MKDKLKNPRFARATSVAVLILSLFLGTTVSINRQARRIEQMFYDGVPDSAQGYTRPSINSQLIVRADAALGLITAAADSGAESEISDLRAAREELLAAGSIAEKSAADARLSRAFTALLKRVESKGGARAAELARVYSEEFDGTLGVIISSGYNNEARVELIRAARSFPARIFAIDAFINYPDPF
ncbi:MAG: hypothetical protein LBK23_08610 [Oscillospiraceae bacterium]|jgi:hypothetical protein|nr:hypothetical protein [Oscillospiraceae bacterium]